MVGHAQPISWCFWAGGHVIVAVGNYKVLGSMPFFPTCDFIFLLQFFHRDSFLSHAF